MGDAGSNKRVANSLLALSSAAVLAVYAAGYTRTRAAADRFATLSVARRPVSPQTFRPMAYTTQTVEKRIASTEEAFRKADAPVARKKSPVTRIPKPGSPRLHAGDLKAPTAPATVEASAPLPEPVVEAPAPPPPPPPPAPKYKDGTYYGWGTSRHGDIQAAVVIEEGRIASATIAQCLTRYSCNVIGILPPQVAQRQSPEVDYVSGATQSTNAFYYAVVEALGKAKH